MPGTFASFGRRRSMISSAVALALDVRLERDEHRAGVAGAAAPPPTNDSDVVDVGIGVHDLR